MHEVIARNNLSGEIRVVQVNPGISNGDGDVHRSSRHIPGGRGIDGREIPLIRAVVCIVRGFQRVDRVIRLRETDRRQRGQLFGQRELLPGRHLHDADVQLIESSHDAEAAGRQDTRLLLGPGRRFERDDQPSHCVVRRTIRKRLQRGRDEGRRKTLGLRGHAQNHTAPRDQEADCSQE